MNAARIVLLALAVTAVAASVAAKADLPNAGVGAAQSTSHERAVLAAEFVATYDADSRTTDISFTCAAAGALDAWLYCIVFTTTSSYTFTDHPGAPAALVNGKLSLPVDDDDIVKVCARLRGTSVVPDACAGSAVP